MQLLTGFRFLYQPAELLLWVRFGASWPGVDGLLLLLPGAVLTALPWLQRARSRSLSKRQQHHLRSLLLHAHMLEAAVRPDEEVHSSSEIAGEGLRQLDALLAAARSLIAAYAGEAAPGPPLAPAQPGAASLDPSALASARERYMAASSGLRATLQRLDARQQEESDARQEDAGAKLSRFTSLWSASTIVSAPAISVLCTSGGQLAM